MNINIKGKVYLVGAGCGDPELLTLKAHKLLLNTEVVLYDALVSKSILNINPFSEKIFVGKRKGFKAMKQEKINQLMVDLANDGKNVVRLKGGDPMIFGRAHEEILYLHLNTIECEVIPGISSYTGIASYNKIPITKRNEIESFIVTTGFTTKGDISEDITFAMQTNATVIVLMGISNLEKLIKEFKKYKPYDYPVAIIQNGTTTIEKSIIGTLENIVSLVNDVGIFSPANIIFGYAVNDVIVDFRNLIKRPQTKK